MSFFGSLLSAGSSLIGGLLNSSNQAQVNQQNIQEAQWSAEGGYLPGLVSNAKAAGINPLAVLGSNAPSMPVSVGTSPGDSLKGSGQDLGRAVSALADTSSKTDALNQELLQAKIDNTKADTAATMARASQVATNLGQPGTPPSAPYVPLPRSDPRYSAKNVPAAQTFLMPDGQVVVAPSDEFTRSSFATDPLGKLRMLSIDASGVQRPDIARGVENLQLPDPGPGAWTN